MHSEMLFARALVRQQDNRRSAERRRATTGSQRRPASRPRRSRKPMARPPITVEKLGQKADEFGQMDLGDPRWVQMETVLDRALRDAVTRSEDPRAAVWEEIVDDPRTPLVVKLRTFAGALPTLR